MLPEGKLALKGRQLCIIDGPPDLTGTGSSTPSNERALLVFVKDRRALEHQRGSIVDSVRAGHLTWVAYPKAGQLGTDLNRDSVARLLRNERVRPVTQVALDSTWSALRFRPDPDG